jgi:hypothetical protein
MDTLPRGIEDRLSRSMLHAPVAILEGGRAVGKSTLCRIVGARHGWGPPIDLSSPGAIDQLRIDPIRFLRALPTPAIIDEAQLEPQLPLWIKLVVDERNGAPGQFILTGSARLGRDQLGGSDPLAGRSTRLRMWPLTLSEREGSPQHTASALFDPSRFDVGSVAAPTPLHLPPTWLRGGLPGLPGVLREAPGYEWSRAMGSYVDATIPLGLTTTRVDHSRLLRVFRYLASNPGQLLNLARASSELGMKADTVGSYLDTLEASFLLIRAEAQRPAEHRVLTAHPRVFAADVGLSWWALGAIDEDPLPIQLGSLLANLVAVELAASAQWADEVHLIRHWRDQRSKKECDLAVVHPDGRLAAIEVKAAGSVGPGDVTGLVALATAHGESFAAGYVAYMGSRVVDLSPTSVPPGSILAVPLPTLLRAGTRPTAAHVS